ncbi:zn 2cys6 transcription factor [Colletotrichum scovillei]|uniref:Zn 2cys6 transcription factor n=1 Tax=Colletotrichum scovillei TaxID=1209932 RepID=A0A9P7R1A3_9PEZI|nr:zn 2cys6 transcription factor [Colletotrichum scovillei]
MKPRRCCDACRRRHRKCVVQPGATGCGACFEADLECHFDTTLRFKHAPGSSRKAALSEDRVQKADHRARRKSEVSRLDDETSEASSSPAVQSVRTAGDRSNSFTSHPSPHGLTPYEGQLNFDYSPPATHAFRAEAPAQRFTGHGLISDAEFRIQPVDPEHCGFTGRQAFLFRTYILRIAPSIDACHDARPFTLEVPRLALRKPILLNGIFALASRFDTQGNDDTNEKSDLESTYYHNRCIELLIEAFSQPPETWDSILLTAVVIMRLYEEYDNETDSHYHHLRGTRNLLNHDAIARFVTQGGLAEAASWVHLRQALYVFLVRRTPIEICLENFERSSTFRSNDDTAHANRIVYLFAKVLKLFFPEDGSGFSTSSSETWEELQNDVDVWFKEKPLSFQPLFYERADVAKGRPFPTLWMAADPGTVALGYYYASKAIFSFQDYNSSNPTAGFEGTKKRMDSEREITFSLCMLMGLARSNEAVNAYYLPAHMLSLYIRSNENIQSSTSHK